MVSTTRGTLHKPVHYPFALAQRAQIQHLNLFLDSESRFKPIFEGPLDKYFKRKARTLYFSLAAAMIYSSQSHLRRLLLRWLRAAGVNDCTLSPQIKGVNWLRAATADRKCFGSELGKMEERDLSLKVKIKSHCYTFIAAGGRYTSTQHDESRQCENLHGVTAQPEGSGFDCDPGLSVWSRHHVLPVPVWVRTRNSGEL